MLTEIAHRLTAVWHWTTHDPVSFYTAVLALSTIALWIVTWQGIRKRYCERVGRSTSIGKPILWRLKDWACRQ
jgi:ATP/ADP translocase